MAGAESCVRSPGWVQRWRARPGVRFALVVLALVISSAVFAPFLASSRPYVLVAVDRGAYETSLAELEPLAASWNTRLIEAAAARQALREDEPATIHAVFIAQQAVARELRALELRIATVRRFASAEREVQVPLDALELRARGWTEKVHEGKLDDLGPAAELARDAARLRETHRPRGAQGDGVALREQRTYPLLADLERVDWFAAFAWLGVLVLALLGAPARRVLAWLAASLLFAWICDIAFRAPSGFATREVKQGLASGALEASSAWFPPIAFGRDETRLAEAARPPTWLEASRAERPGSAARLDALPGEPAADSRWRHLLGTDSLGRDVLARLLWGGRTSLTAGALAALGILTLGTLLGALAGYARGPLDALVRALIAVLQSFPPFFLVVTAVAIGSERASLSRVSPLGWVVGVLVVVGWTGVARLVRAEALRVRELDYVVAARALGYSVPRLLFRHVLPNVLAPALASASFVALSALLAESSVSFLGFGVQAPVPSWGALMQEARGLSLAWLVVAPGCLIFATCIALSWLGDAARDALDPREET